MLWTNAAEYSNGCMGEDGNLRGAVERQIARLRLSEVEVLGARRQEEVLRLLRASDAFVLPSIVTPQGMMEGIPVSLMEAMSVGLPVIATRVSGLPELV